LSDYHFGVAWLNDLVGGPSYPNAVQRDKGQGVYTAKGIADAKRQISEYKFPKYMIERPRDTGKSMYLGEWPELPREFQTEKKEQ
jgi:hypothetical protein